MLPLLTASNASAMAETPLTLIPPPQADIPNAEHESLFRVPISVRKLPLGDYFVKVYERLDQLREGGHHEAADEMDKSLSVSSLVTTAGEDKWQPFDTVWSAKKFREILYHNITPKREAHCGSVILC